MNDTLDVIKLEFNEVIEFALRFCFASRAKEFQLDSIERLEELIKKIVQLKTEMIALEAEDSANQILSLESMAQAISSELKMWVALKNDEPNNAWNHLINAQGYVRTAMQAHRVSERFQSYIEKLYMLEKLLFPPQVFLSPGFIIRESICSICGKDYDECEHVIGRAYMGQICARIIQKADLLEVSIVDKPSDKHARVIAVTTDNVQRDIMTWREINEADEQQ